MLSVRAFAKINLSLAVGAPRSDGLHPVVSVMQAIDLADDVTVTPAADFACTVEPADAAPPDDSNLALRAARSFAAVHLEDDAAVAVHLIKRIPSEAGLGGGSADAAGVFVALNEATGGTVSRKALERLGAGLGADVPFAIRGGTAVAMGIGDELTTIPCPLTLWWVLGTSPVGCSTAAVYARFDARGDAAVGVDHRGDAHEIADALSRRDLATVAGLLRNDLEAAACEVQPSLLGGDVALREAGAIGTVLCGSGATWAGLAADEASANAIAARLQGSGRFAATHVVRSIPHGPESVADLPR